MSVPRPTLRLLYHAQGDAAWNMAVDQAIAEATGSALASAPTTEHGAMTLRFYTWKQPTLSLGYFQQSDQVTSRFDGLAKVRRSTGGGAILHDQELTYSLTVPTAVGEHGARTDLYRGVHSAFAAVLRQYGIDAQPFHLNKWIESDPDGFLCFQRRTDEDLVVSGYKILGSAQRRFKRAVLQHGSLLLGTSRCTPELPGLTELTSVALEPQDLAIKIATAIANALSVDLKTAVFDAELTAAEATRSSEIVNIRFGQDRWWLRR